jgi:uncharacterized protein (TIGR03437 family)
MKAMTKRIFFVCLSLFLTALQAAVAAPTLRLTLPETLRLQNGEMRPVWIAAGTNGPTNLSVEAWNSGDGALNLSVNGGSAAWLKPVVQGTQPCSSNPSRTCTIVRVLFETASLTRGTYQGEVVIQDANALDAPQRVPIKAYVGGNVPEQVSLYLRPSEDSTDWVEFETPEPANRNEATTLTAQPSGFVTVSTSGAGSFQFLYTHRITAKYRPGTPVGQSSGTATISRSGFAADNRAVPVRVQVSNDPIAQVSARTLQVVTAQDIDAPVQAVVLTNRGNGTLSVTGVEATTTSGGSWLSAAVSQAVQAAGGGPAQAGGQAIYLVTAKKDGLAPGVYTGNLRFATNAANGPINVGVQFEVAAQRPPELLYRGVVNGATFSQNQPLAPGAIVSLFGSQLAYSVAGASSTPLPRELASTKVLVGGVEAPLFFASWGQINFQVPYEAQQGNTTVQVVRGGQAGNRITAMIAERTSGLFRLNPVFTGLYGAITNASQGNNFPIPRALAASLGINGAPARPGDVLTIYATGLGPVSPTVPTGQVAPSQEPLARGVQIPTVNFLGQFLLARRQTPIFVGLAPGFVGLFQINVTIPDDLPAGDRTPINVEYSSGDLSNTVEIAVER